MIRKSTRGSTRKQASHPIFYCLSIGADDELVKSLVIWVKIFPLAAKVLTGQIADSQQTC
jgi:hypothetical protein